MMSWHESKERLLKMISSAGHEFWNRSALGRPYDGALSTVSNRALTVSYTIFGQYGINPHLNASKCAAWWHPSRLKTG